MSAPNPLNQAVIAQALYDLRNGNRAAARRWDSVRKNWMRSSIRR